MWLFHVTAEQLLNICSAEAVSHHSLAQLLEDLEPVFVAQQEPHPCCHVQ